MTGKQARAQRRSLANKRSGSVTRLEKDTLGRCNTNKRGPKVDEPITSEQLAWAQEKARIRQANRQSDAYYPH